MAVYRHVILNRFAKSLAHAQARLVEPSGAGQTKNTAQLKALFALVNLWMVRLHLMHAMGQLRLLMIERLPEKDALLPNKPTNLGGRILLYCENQVRLRFADRAAPGSLFAHP